MPALDIPEALTFSNANDVEMILKHYDLQTHDFVKDGVEFINYIGDESLDKYRNFFIELSKNHT